MKKMTYKEQEERLFQEWIDKYKSNDPGFTDDMFCYDGLLFRGKHEIVVNESTAKKYWVRRSGNETENWDNAMVKLLILTKDTTEEGGQDDVREETGRKNPPNGEIETSGKKFYKNLTMWSYALIQMFLGNKRMTYEELPSWDELREHYETAPIARVNCKKEIGEPTCPDDILKKHMETYLKFLKQQIDMYDANIIICCGTKIKIDIKCCGKEKIDFMEYCINDLEAFPSPIKDKEEIWVYFSPSTKRIVIDSIHPSWRDFNKESVIEEKYELMMDHVEAFLKEYPDFIRTNK